jgi:hypothetical protein
MYAITGMQTGAANREVTYINDGDYPLVFSAENTASTAANRFAGKTDFYCYPGKSITWIYDATASRWRAKGYSGEIDYSYAPMMARQYNGASSTAADWGNFTFIVSGTGATTPGASASSANVYSSYTPATGSTNAGVAGVAYNKNFLPYWGTAYRKNTAQVLIPTLSNSTDRYTLFFRESNTLAPTTLANNTIGIRYSDNVNSGKWECFVRNNSGTESVLDSGVTVSTSTIYNLEYIVCKGLNEVRFYINGVYVGSITTNMPTSGQVYVPHVTIVKSVGTASLGFSWMKGSTLYMY